MNWSALLSELWIGSFESGSRAAAAKARAHEHASTRGCRVGPSVARRTSL